MKRKTLSQIRKQKDKGKLVMLTAYDAPSARLADKVSDIILVGDSLATTVQGKTSTLSVSLEEMLYHTQLVVKNTTRAMVIADMPFMSYQISVEDALRNAGRLIQDGGADGIKLEGGVRVQKQVQSITQAGIPVMGHLGFTPQSLKVTGMSVHRNQEELLHDAQALQEAGAFALVLEMVPAEIARLVSQKLEIPTIGIGAGPDCNGQVLVFHDLLGFDPDFQPRFVKRYLHFFEQAEEALGNFRKDVLNGTYPGPEHSYE